MKKFMLLCSLIIAFTNCKDKTETNTTIEPSEKVESNTSTDVLQIGCYSYQDKRNSVTFEITKMDYNVKGHLEYHLAEKDANRGLFEGFLIEDILLGDYIFQSEGTTSKREVIFKIINGQLIEGYGRMDEEGICFVNTDHVTYSSTMPLTKTDCNK